MKFNINGRIYDTEKSELLYDSGRYPSHDSDLGFLGDNQEMFYVTENGRFFEVCRFWQAASILERIFCLRPKVSAVPEINAYERSLSDLSRLLHKMKPGDLKNKIGKIYSKEA